MSFLRWITALLIAIATGCSTDGKSDYSTASSDGIEFQDDLTANTPVDEDLSTLVFTSQSGEQVSLKDYLGKKSLVLVITRGYSGTICPYCATQTSRLIANYQKFRERNAEVIVVYPLEKPADQPNLDLFVSKAVSTLPADEKSVPFPILLDVELKAVDKLGIRRSLSKPATYIFDSEGKVQFAYVGKSLSDRPSVKAMLAQLDRLNQPR